MKLILLFSLNFPILFFAQVKADIIKTKYQFGIGIESNFFKVPKLNGKWNDINPNFIEPSIEDTAYNSFDGNLYSSHTRYNMSFQMKQNLKNRKFSFAPRINFEFGEGLRASQDWIKSESYTYDTLTSNSSGQDFFLDSNVLHEQFFNFKSKSINLKIGLMFEYELNAQFAFYSGIDLGFGKHFSFKETKISSNYYFISESETNYRGSNQVINYQNVTYEKQNASLFPIKMNQLMVGIPIGVKFRLSKKENFMNHFLLSYEYNFNQSYFKISSAYQKNKELARFNQFQHSHLFRIMYEL